MAAPTSGPTGGSVPLVGALIRTDLPVDGLVVYFREPSAALQLTAVIDSILDPPRQT